MTIRERIDHDLKNAMRNKDQKTLAVMRLITAAVKQVEVDERITVDDARMLIILDKLAKQRNESIVQFKAAHRDDLVSQEQFELGIIGTYLPEPLTEAEITQHIEQALLAVNATSMSDMGKVMAELKPILQGRADMSQVSSLIKAKLRPN